MTTIIADRRTLCMYSDSLCTWGDSSFSIKKIQKIGQSLWGISGDMDNGFKFLEWVKAGGKDDADLSDDEFDALELTREGIFVWGRQLVRLSVREDYFSIGSGSAFALGAMAHGATPQEAIQIAARWDTGTRPPIEMLKLGRATGGNHGTGRRTP